ALTVVCADFLQQQIFKEKVKYEYSLGLILILTALTTTLEFTGIVQMLSPVLQVIYPSLLVLCLFNILHKTLAVKSIKIPVFAAMSLVLYFQHVA
ncbi:MAG: branched-chain amino acid transport system II carrier protein, partial [Simkania sp.]|nr:branched-chain amino acid transport system II carrier protein [Simkania sp.]